MVGQRNIRQMPRVAKRDKEYTRDRAKLIVWKTEKAKGVVRKKR